MKPMHSIKMMDISVRKNLDNRFIIKTTPFKFTVDKGIVFEQKD